MKKILAFMLGAVALTACSTEYYRGNVRYAQDNENCIYEFAQKGKFVRKDFDEKKRLVYKEALCRDVIKGDMNIVQRPAPRPQVAPAPKTTVVNQVTPIVYQTNHYVVHNNPMIASTARHYAGREIEIVIE